MITKSFVLVGKAKTVFALIALKAKLEKEKNDNVRGN